MNLHISLIVLMLTVFPLVFVPNSWLDTAMLRWIILLVTGAVALLLLIKEKLYTRTDCLKPLGIFLGFALLSSALSHHQLWAWLGAPYRHTGFVSYIAFCVLFLLAFGIASRKPEQIGRIIDIWMVSTCIIAYLGILQYLGVSLVEIMNHEFLQVSRSYGTIGNSNHFGTYIAMAFPFAAVSS